MSGDNGKNKPEGSNQRPPMVIRSPQWDDDYYRLVLQVAEEAGYPICGAHTRSGGVCRQYRGARNGNGRCRFHGGNAGRPPTHGLYSKRLKDAKRRKELLYFLDSGPTKDLSGEIAFLRASLTDYLNRVAELPPYVVNEDPGRLEKGLTACVKAIEAIMKLTEYQNRLAESEEGKTPPDKEVS